MKNKPPYISDEDQKLWNDFTKDIRRITNDKLTKNLPKKSVFINQQARFEIPKAAANFKVSLLNSKELRTLKIEKTLDLHGFSATTAKQKTEHFLHNAYNNGIKLVLIVTGKGKPENPGILRTLLPEWLQSLAAIVIGYTPANIQDGGSGAFYIKIRRKK